MTFQTFTPIEYLMIDIANAFGKDKLDWNDRIQWFNDHENKLSDLVKSADEPAMMFAGIQAYNKATKNEAIGYPISLDACCSGLQFLSLLSGCKKSALLCGVVDTGHREDAYTSLYKVLCDEANIEGKIQRADMKSAIMTSLYGSEAVPREIFGQGELLDLFFQVMEREAPGAWELNKALQEFWDPTKYTNDWVLPDNFHVHINVMKPVTERVRFNGGVYDVNYRVNEPVQSSKSLGPNVVHSIDAFVIREMGRRCMYNMDHIMNVIRASERRNRSDSRQKDKMVNTLWENYQNSGYLSARILDYLDEQNMGNVDAVRVMELIQSMPSKPFQILTIHDCFRAIPTYGNDLRKQYNTVLSEICSSDLLSYIVSQLKGRKIPVSKYGLQAKEVIEANYSLS
jgi:hypothetical protein